MTGTCLTRTRVGALALVATGVLIATAATWTTPVSARVTADINVHIGDRPAPVVVFHDEPDVVLVPSSRVYYVDHDGYDLYRYGRYWYINDDGYWFRASGYRGPFLSIAVGRVPRSIVVVPARYRRHPVHPHGGPPGLAKKRGVYRDNDRSVRRRSDDRDDRDRRYRIDDRDVRDRRDSDDRDDDRSRGKGKKEKN